jgi:hypothetical protein
MRNRLLFGLTVVMAAALLLTGTLNAAERVVLCEELYQET